mgnify:CR=1 FL=1
MGSREVVYWPAVSKTEGWRCDERKGASTLSCRVVSRVGGVLTVLSYWRKRRPRRICNPNVCQTRMHDGCVPDTVVRKTRLQSVDRRCNGNALAMMGVVRVVLHEREWRSDRGKGFTVKASETRESSNRPPLSVRFTRLRRVRGWNRSGLCARSKMDGLQGSL